MVDLTSKLVAYEEGHLSDEDTIKLFQHLVDTELAWSLQGFYGRTAAVLIEKGYITNKKEKND
jgi:hypothetical protein